MALIEIVRAVKEAVRPWYIDYYLTSSLFQAANAEEWRKLQAAFKSEIDNREAQEGACP